MSKYPRSIVAYQICLIQIVLYLIVIKPSPTDAGLANGGKYTTVHEPALCKPKNQLSACRVCKDITHIYAL